jgi:hypothetical protein
MFWQKFLKYRKERNKPGKKYNARITLVEIVDKFIDIYNTNEMGVLKKMRSEYANIIVAILPIIYQKDKV